MPSFSVGFAQVEERLRIIRRRLNLLTLQDAIYRGGSLVALAATLLIALAMRDATWPFAIAAWSAAAAMVAALSAAALRIHRHWLSGDQVAGFADRHAGLDDRLKTLLDLRRPPARLHGLLLEQVLAATPRWDVDALAPRRIPRSLAALAASLATLIATSYFVRAPAVPRSAAPPPAPRNTTADAVAPQPGTGSARSAAASAAQTVAALQAAGAADAERGTAHASAAAFRAGDSAPGEAAAGETAGNASAGRLGQHDRAASNPSDGVAPGMANKLQDAIRKALGAGGDSDIPHPGAQPGAQAHQASDQHRSTQPHSDSGTGEQRQGTESSHPPTAANSTQPRSASSNLPGTGSAAAAGTRGAHAGGLFGSAADAPAPTGGSQNLPVALGALSTLAPGGMEPRPQDAPRSDGAAANAHAPAAPADEQIADAPLQKAEVAPEHEALIRRIFTRDE